MAPYVQGLRQVPLKLRTTLRSTAAAIGLSKRTFRRHMPVLGVKPHKRFLKPLLTNAGKIARLRWARRWTNAPIGGMRKFNGMRRVVHVGEKWFHVRKDRQKYFLFSDEEPQTRKVQFKSHTTKVMFLGAVARPQSNVSTGSDFDGKIGIWVCQDNARPHLINNDEELQTALTADGWDIRLINQPANSPDTNILDLGFFNSIQQSLQDRTSPKKIDDLVEDVNNRVWLSLQACLEQIMLAGGDNTYKLPHFGKRQLENACTLPWQLRCTEKAWEKGASKLAGLEAAAAEGAERLQRVEQRQVAERQQGTEQGGPLEIELV
ncbi:unnamed protein product [Ectocarpus sp. 4 AP-2014]